MYSIETPWLHIGTDTASGSDTDNTILVKRDVIVRDIDECTYDGTNAYFKHKCVREVSTIQCYIHMMPNTLKYSVFVYMPTAVRDS
jgi:hypothetical protein